MNSCASCGRKFGDSDHVYDLVKGEYEPENEGMSAVGCVGRLCEQCATWVIDAIFLKGKKSRKA